MSIYSHPTLLYSLSLLTYKKNKQPKGNNRSSESQDANWTKDKNAAKVNIAPALVKIIKHVKYRSMATDQGVRLKGMSRILCKVSHLQLP